MNASINNSLNKHYSKQKVAEETMYVPAVEIIDRFKGKWKEHVAAAKAAWVLVGERQLLKSEGRRVNLVWLLQGHYTMSGADANRQIELFMQERGV